MDVIQSGNINEGLELGVTFRYSAWTAPNVDANLWPRRIENLRRSITSNPRISSIGNPVDVSTCQLVVANYPGF